MICPECNGKGETIYYVETDRDEYTVTVEQRKGVCRNCNGSGTKPMTNADRIRAMSDEELACELMTWLIEPDSKHQGVKSNYPNTRSLMLKWLKQPVKESED